MYISLRMACVSVCVWEEPCRIHWMAPNIITSVGNKGVIYHFFFLLFFFLSTSHLPFNPKYISVWVLLPPLLRPMPSLLLNPLGTFGFLLTCDKLSHSWLLSVSWDTLCAFGFKILLFSGFPSYIFVSSPVLILLLLLVFKYWSSSRFSPRLFLVFYTVDPTLVDGKCVHSHDCRSFLRADDFLTSPFRSRSYSKLPVSS